MIAAVTMVRDEADILPLTLGNMLAQTDLVIVADNGSTDETPEILAQFIEDGANLIVHDDPEVAYYQSAKVTALAHEARELGAYWVIPFDADEWWQGGASLRDILNGLPPEALIAEAALFDHVASPEGMDYRRAEAAPLRKVAVRAAEGLTIHQGNHSAAFDRIRHPLTVTGQLEVHHFPYRSPEQFVRKAVNGGRAYEASNLPPSIGAHWRGYYETFKREGAQALIDHFYKWFWSDDPEADGLIHDPCLPSKSLSPG